ncbi:MAG: permease-like cell division protein FtsX [Armatimonadetes bacterium]|nr:permease-like cell division protein FtsX [Armatimonadota bacterium]
MNLSTVEFVLHEAWISLRRNGVIAAAAITNIAAVLIVSGMFLLVVINLDAALGEQSAKAVVTVDLAPKADAARVQAILMADPRVAKVEFVSKEENLAALARAQGWDLKNLRYLENPLPDCLRVKTARPADLPAVAAAARGIDGVADVRYAEEVTLRLLRLARGVKTVGLVITVALAVASLLVAHTTIRLTVYARRREIRVMQLVGATNWFIRMPFLVEGAFCGLAGGVIATVLLLASYSYLDEQVTATLPFVNLVFGSAQLALLALVVIGAGLVFGVAGSILATQEYLREV